MTKRTKDTAETLSDYIKEAGGSLFSLRNSFVPLSGKKMSVADKAILTDLYSRTRRELLGDKQDETDTRRRIFP